MKEGKIRFVFLKAAARQPVYTILLMLLTTAASFMLVLALLQCALVFSEIAQAEDRYRAIGMLEETGPGADRQKMTEYLEENPYIKFVEKSWLTSGVLPEGVYNADTEGDIFGPDRDVYYSGACQTDILFYGTIRSVEDQKSGYLLRTVVEEVVTGYPEYLAPGKELELTVTSDDVAAAEGLVPGERYLLRATYNPDICYDNGAMRKYLFVPLTEEGEPVLEAPQNLDLEAPEYRELAFEVQTINENQRAMSVWAVSDMSALPSVQESVGTYYLREGRLLTAADTEEARQVCVIRDAFADLRGYGIWDTVTLKLRNIFAVSGYLTLETDARSYDMIPSQEVTLEIVGILGREDGIGNSNDNLIFIPASLLPKTFQPRMTYTGVSLEETASSFVLNTPEDTQAFLKAATDDLLEMGFEVTIIETDWELFKASSNSVRKTAQNTAILLAPTALAVMGFLAAVYFRLRRQELAVSRALGAPVRSCILASVLPLLLIDGVGALIGGGLGGWSAAARTEDLLSELTGLQGEVSIDVPAGWWILASLSALLITVALAFAAGAAAARRPVRRMFKTR